MRRTHTCGQLSSKNIKESAILNGWVDSRRDHGGLIFIDIRDRYGFTQLVFDPKNKESFEIANSLRREFVISVEGVIRARPEGMTNPKLATGEIELLVSKIEILNKADVPPLEVDDRIVASEDLRLKYRYLDLRRPIMQHNLLTRHKAAQAVREYLSSQNFLEIETPMFVKTTPGGARVFKVASRIHPGKFYALPESPQMYKQLLMVSGCDRYFQLARCMRDEDLRQDRQPEFTQIDMEMSFVEEEDVFSIVEGLLKNTFKKAANIEIETPFLRMTYQQAMEKYGSDKPDLRFGLELCNVSNVMKKTDFSIFKTALSEEKVIYCLNAKGAGNFSRKDIDELIELGKTHHLPGVAWMKVGKDLKLESSIVKYFNEPLQKELLETVNAEENDLLLFAAEHFEKAVTGLGQLRLHIGNKLGLITPNLLKFCWVIDFPLFEWNEDERKWQAKHHIFSMPKEQYFDYLEKDPSKVLGKLYDVVLNGVEIGGGSIRIHRKDIQTRVLKVIGLSYEEAEKRFDFLLEAFKYGAPPHGGIALGFDRLVALMSGYNDIREVMAFPKNKAAECPMDGSPQDWNDQFLKELHLKLDFVKKA